MNIKNIAATTAALMLVGSAVTGCTSEADTASHNVSKAADEFKVMRRVVFVNGITDKYLLVIEGRCSLGNFDAERELSVTCKTGDGPDGKGLYRKHFLGLSDNVTYVVEQLEDTLASGYHYKLLFRPETLLPDIDLRVEGD